MASVTKHLLQVVFVWARQKVLQCKSVGKMSIVVIIAHIKESGVYVVLAVPIWG